MKMLKASAARGLVIPVNVKKVDGDIIHPDKGGVDQRNSGYIRYFEAEEATEAMKWINHQRKRWGLKLLTRKEMSNEN